MIMLGGFGVLAFLVYAGGRALDRYGGTEEFVLHGKSGETVYEETVGPPVRVYAWAIAAVTLTWLVLPIVVLLVLLPGSLGVGHVGSYLAFLLRHPPWAVLLAVTGAAAGLLLLFGNRTISYSRSGILLPVGPFKSRRLIPADAVVSCEEVDYPAWPASWFAGPVRDHQDTRTIRVPGYRGPAVLLHYHPGRKRKGDRKQTSEVGSILFPCRRPGHICSLLSQDIDL
jgi:hypothetical protein